MKNAAYWLFACSCWVVACGDDGSETLIGATCKVSEDCGVGGVCITESEGGLCALPCQVPGGARECPLGAYCDREVYSSDKKSTGEMTLCLPACKEQSDCRNGYSCSGVSSGPGKVCRPN